MNSNENEIDYSEGIWTRLLFMMLFGFIYSVVEFVLFLLVIIQFGFVVITGLRNERLVELGANLATFIYQIVRYFVFNTNEKPFPFAAWPDAKRGIESDF